MKFTRNFLMVLTAVAISLLAIGLWYWQTSQPAMDAKVSIPVTSPPAISTAVAAPSEGNRVMVLPADSLPATVATVDRGQPTVVSSLWVSARTATARARIISQLASSTTPDDWMFAKFLAKECQLARVYAETPDDTGKGTAFENALRTDGKLTSAELASARALVIKAQQGCEESGKLSEMPFLLGASRRAREAGSLVAQMELSPRTLLGGTKWEDVSARQQNALLTGLGNPVIASAWLTDRLPEMSGGRDFSGALEGLTGPEAVAVMVLSTCALGVDCGGQSMQRLHACAMAFACAGDSVDAAINGHYGPRAAELTARAGRFVEAITAGNFRDAGLFK